MIAQHPHRRGDSDVPAWTRTLALVVTAITQVIPLLAGVYLVSTAGVADGRPLARLLAGVAFIGSAATMLYGVRREWRDGRRIGRSPALLAGVALLVIGMLALMP